MWAPNDGAALGGHTLRRILEDQGPEAVRQVLTGFDPPCEHLRQHIKTCSNCADVKREVFGDQDIPVTNDYLTPQLLELLREAGG